MLSAEHPRIVVRNGLGRRVLAGTAGAVIGVGACFFIASSTGAALIVAVRETATSVPFEAPVFATAAAGGGAYVLARWSGRARRPRRIFLMLTMAGLLASAVPPLQAATTVSTAIWLLAMHAVAAMGLVPVVASGMPSVRLVGGAQVAPQTATSVSGSAALDGHQ